MAVLGVALLPSQLPRWVGWSLVASMVLFAVFTVVFAGIAPLVFYLTTLVVGVAMLFRPGSCPVAQLGGTASRT